MVFKVGLFVLLTLGLFTVYVLAGGNTSPLPPGWQSHIGELVRLR